MDKATVKVSKGDGMGTLKASVIRESGGANLGTIRYNPDSLASCEAMEENIASICGRYGVEIIEK